MAQTLVNLLVHIIFSTKHRADLIEPEIEGELFAYMAGIVNNNKSKLIIAGGTKNHVHLLVSLGKTISLSELVGDIKRDSSKWLKTKNATFQGFYWQDGYGAFSVGQSQLERVKDYIARQKEKHATRSFEDEVRAFLKKYGVEYDERYIWD
ncbi:MAG TPA: IS200/IS605 family transposase [Blastocatellia bacterium]|nr:IS200/IS605 family transposase [Blastocatellia bacterium]